MNIKFLAKFITILCVNLSYAGLASLPQKKNRQYELDLKVQYLKICNAIFIKVNSLTKRIG